MLLIWERFRINYYRRKGQKLLVQGKPEKAYRYFEKTVLLDDSSGNIYNLALVLLTLGRYDEAEKYLEKVLQENPGNELATLTMAELMMQKRDWKNAEELIASLVLYHPTNNNYRKYLERIRDPKGRENYIKGKELLNKSQEQLQNKKIKDALKTLHQAAECDPENPFIQNNLGSFYLMLEKKPKKALTHFQKAYQLDPENPKFKQNLYQVRKKISE